MQLTSRQVHHLIIPPGKEGFLVCLEKDKLAALYAPGVDTGCVYRRDGFVPVLAEV